MSFDKSRKENQLTYHNKADYIVHIATKNGFFERLLYIILILDDDVIGQNVHFIGTKDLSC